MCGTFFVYLIKKEEEVEEPSSMKNSIEKQLSDEVKHKSKEKWA